MSNFDQNALENFARIRNFDYSNLIQQERLGDWNLRECADILTKAADLFRAATDEELSGLPPQRRIMIAEAAQKVENAITRCKQFDRQNNGSANERSALLGDVNTAYQMAFDALASALPIFQGAQDTLARLNNNLMRLKRATEETEENARATRNAAESAKTAATAAGFDANLNLFSGATNIYRKDSKKWLISTFGFILALIVAAVIVIYYPPPINPNLKLAEIAFLTNKLLLLGGFGFAVFVSYKNYISAKHNETVNLQRANALSTYQAVISELSPEEKAPIIIAAANCIYNHQGSGYSPIEPSVSILGSAVDTITSTVK